MANLLFSPAKINLGLRILGRNIADYHLLESIFLPLDFGDQIEITPSNQNHVATTWAIEAPIKSTLPVEDYNIVTKLLNLLPSTWDVKINKKIPLGAGLGGGSSNAGTILKYLLSINAINLQTAKTIALKLGADVPFFITPTPSWVTGVGENCTALKIKNEIWNEFVVLLVIIPEHCNTAEIFTAYKSMNLPFSTTSIPPKSEAELNAYLLSTKNDLEQVVIQKFSNIQQVLSQLHANTKGFSCLSGSGSTCYTLCTRSTINEIKVKELSELFRKVGCKTVTANIQHESLTT